MDLAHHGITAISWNIMLGEQWQDMLIPFCLMLLFIFLDLIRLTIVLLFMVVGRPHRLE